VGALVHLCIDRLQQSKQRETRNSSKQEGEKSEGIDARRREDMTIVSIVIGAFDHDTVWYGNWFGSVQFEAIYLVLRRTRRTASQQGH